MQRPSGLVGPGVYVLILLPVLTAALNALGLGAVTQPVSDVMNSLLAAIPRIFAAALVLLSPNTHKLLNVRRQCC